MRKNIVKFCDSPETLHDAEELSGVQRETWHDLKETSYDL